MMWRGVFFFVGALLLAQVHAAESESELLELPQVLRDSLPDFFARDIRDDLNLFSKSTLRELSKGYDRVAIVYYATWCIPCREGLVQIASKREYLEGKKVKVVLANVGEKERNPNEKVRQYLKKLRLDSFPGTLDPYNRLLVDFGIWDETEETKQNALPMTLVLDKNLKPLLLIGKEGNDFIEKIAGK
ncbi:MAG: TlpA family protein disulfide reductase [Fibrobacter sp.]|nr:TlpA family protein disulfide reductase [Fibrobacter sp.]